MNNLTIHMFQSGTTEDLLAADYLRRAESLTFSTVFPGGVFAECSFYIPGGTSTEWVVRRQTRMVVRNGIKTVWEGVVKNIEKSENASGEGVIIYASGQWGELDKRMMNKVWADTELTEMVWPWDATRTAADKATLDRNSQLKFTPKAEAWTTGQIVSCDYTMPTGETIKHITCDYVLASGAQSWQLRLRDTVTPATWTSATASATGSWDHEPVTPVQSVSLQFMADANQTPTADGTYYGQVDNVTIYSVTGAVDLTQIATDIVSEFSGLLCSNTALIESNTLSLVPFKTNGFQRATEILNTAASYGDSDYDAWVCYVDDSDLGGKDDGKCVLVVKQAPALTDWDYAVRLDDKQIMSGARIERNLSEIWNYITISYQNKNNKTIYEGPDDLANLKDDTSIALYGQHEYLLEVGRATQTMARNAGRRFLKEFKDPQYTLTSPLSVISYIRGKDGNLIPASEIRAGKRLLVEDFINDINTSATNLGNIFIITSTRYNDANETCDISIGYIDRLPVYLARLKRTK